MNENMNNLTGTMGQTQSFNLMPDITLPNIDMSSQDSGLAELTIVRGPSTGRALHPRHPRGHHRSRPKLRGLP